MSSTKVIYMFSQSYLIALNNYLNANTRDRETHLYMNTTGLLSLCQLIHPKTASVECLLDYHTSEYIETLQSHQSVDDQTQVLHGLHELFFKNKRNRWTTCTVIVGATMLACSHVARGVCQTAINWAGGYSFALPNKAVSQSVFNDVIIGTDVLLRTKSHVLIIHFNKKISHAVSFLII